MNDSINNNPEPVSKGSVTDVNISKKHILGGFVVFLVIIFAYRLTADVAIKNSLSDKGTQSLIPVNNKNNDISMRIDAMKDAFSKGSSPDDDTKRIDGIRNSFVKGIQEKINSSYPDSNGSANNTWSEASFLVAEKQKLYESYADSKLILLEDDVSHVSSDNIFSHGLTDDKKTLAMGSVIKIILRSKINSDYPDSPFFGVVGENVYDFDNRYLLISKGDVVVGHVSNILTENPVVEQRMALVVSKIKRSDGSVIELESNVSNFDGTGGVVGDVNNHALKKWGGFIAFSLLGNSVALQSSNNADAQSSQDDALRDITNSFNQSTQRAGDNYLSIKSTVTLSPGSLVNVMVVDDISVSPMRSI